MLPALLIFVLLWLVLAGAVYDILCYRIPNSFVLCIGGLFALFALATGMPWAVLSGHLISFGVVFAAGFILFAFDIFGGGDAKELAALALWLPLEQWLNFMVYTSLYGAALGIMIWLLRYCQFPPAWLVGSPLLYGLYAGAVYPEDNEHLPTALPYCAPIALGFIQFLPSSSVWSSIFLPIIYPS